MKWLDLLKTIAPAILMAVPGAQPFIPLVMSGMTIAESSTAKGADKKAIALNAVQLGADTANTIAKKTVVDSGLAVKTANDSIDLIVDTTNKLHAQVGDNSGK